MITLYVYTYILVLVRLSLVLKLNRESRVYSQDKLGPFCRSAADCVIVLDAIRGKDPHDLSSRNIGLSDPFAVDITKLYVGYLEDADMDVSRPKTWIGYQ